MTDEELPAQAEPPISEDLRERGIDVLRGLLANGKIDLDRFQQALDELLEARSEADFAAVVRRLPPPVELTAPSRRRREPLEISTSMGEVRLEGRWQVSRLTRIRTGMGSVTIDLSDAEFDDWNVEIEVRSAMGMINVIAPRGFEVRQEGRNSGVKSTLEPPIPGFPVVRLSASSEMGMVRLMHQKEKRTRRRRWLGRRGRPEVGR